MSSPSPIDSISAVTLATTHMVAATAFYDAIGFERLYGGPDAAFTSYQIGAGFLNLQLDPAWVPAVPVWGRVILWVIDVDGVHALAVAAGFTPLTSPADAPWGERYFHIRDPSGHELSFARPLDGHQIDRSAPAM
jgi:catechol 2,3-dioxygenase-like lactoylglutathione lyase family enzyme